MLRKSLLACVILLTVLILGGTLPATAQQAIPVNVTQTTFVYSGPGRNSALLEYVGAGKDALADARNLDTSWIRINLDGQVVGWVPVGTVSGEGLESLSVQGGLLSTGTGTYAVDDPDLRNAEQQAIRIQRTMRFVGARYFRLQGFMGANCQDVPAVPASPTFSEAQITRIPELETVQRELGYVTDETTAAISLYKAVCAATGFFPETEYLRGLNHLNNAYNAWNVVRRYLDTLAGVTYVAP